MTGWRGAELVREHHVHFRVHVDSFAAVDLQPRHRVQLLHGRDHDRLVPVNRAVGGLPLAADQDRRASCRVGFT